MWRAVLLMALVVAGSGDRVARANPRCHPAAICCQDHDQWPKTRPGSAYRRRSTGAVPTRNAKAIAKFLKASSWEPILTKPPSSEAARLNLVFVDDASHDPSRQGSNTWFVEIERIERSRNGIVIVTVDGRYTLGPCKGAPKRACLTR